MLGPGGEVRIEDLALLKPVPEADAEDVHLDVFANSLVLLEDYGNDLREAGFGTVEVEDMTADWSVLWRPDRVILRLCGSNMRPAMGRMDMRFCRRFIRLWPSTSLPELWPESGCRPGNVQACTCG